MSSTDDIITQIGKYGDKSHLSLLADFLGSDRDYDRLEALKSMQLIMNRELTEEQRTLVASCLPNIDIVPYSDNARAIGMLFDMVLTMGLTTAAMWDGREVAEPLDQETINAMKSFFETLLD